MKKHLVYLALFFFSCSQSEHGPIVTLEVQHSGTEASFRGLSVVNEQVAWASGSGGTVVTTKDGGAKWQNVSNGLPDSVDFRDIEAFSANEAIILSAGSPGLVFRTEDGGASWEMAYKDDRPEIFFDAMGFWDRKNGIAFGDAINKKIELIETKDGGKTWRQIEEVRRPDALDGEGGFAASGTCLITYGDSSVWIALGIPESRVIISHDRGQSWTSNESPMQQDTGSGGIFSLAFNSSEFGLAIGGDYEDRQSNYKLLAETMDGGKSWKLLENHQLNGQKSAVTAIPGTSQWIATGATGVNFSKDNGKKWSLVDSTGYYTIQMANVKIGWLTGYPGRIAKIRID